MIDIKLIDSATSLADFRRNELTGSAVLGHLSQCRRRIMVHLPVGVGKSVNIDNVIAAAVKEGVYDLVIALFPTRKIIEERAVIKSPPSNIKVVCLKPRPKDSCGQFDSPWSKYEKRQLSALGKSELCQRCDQRRECFWPDQFSKENLAGARVVIGTHAHLAVNPTFVDLIAERAGAKKVLVLIDEDQFAMTNFRQRVTFNALKMLVEVINCLDDGGGFHGAWVFFLEALMGADTVELRTTSWDAPVMTRKMLIAIQERGVDLFEDSFCSPIHSLVAFAWSPLESREKEENGDLTFALVPELETDFIVYSGTACAEFLHYRLGNNFAEPFKNYRFVHPGTVIYNISSRIGMKSYFKKNSKQILDFFGELIARRFVEGKRILLISKKCFISFCVEELQTRITAKGLPLEIVVDGFDADTCSSLRKIPIINYGIIGINDFKDFDCAFCLNGYYVYEELVSVLLQDTLASDIQVPVKITCTQNHPYRRSASVVNANDRIYDVHKFAPQALYQLEMGVVLQAVGRVRPYTSPAEIITFQCADHPAGYTEEFNSLAATRRFFEIESARNADLRATIDTVQAAKAKGLKQREAVVETGCSLSNVQRYWNVDKELEK